VPVEAIVFDYGGVISARLLDDLGPFEAEAGVPPGSVHRLMFGEPDAPVGIVHDFHRLETGEIALGEYLAGLVQRAPDVLGRARSI
jgi:hypothetical protein